MFVIGIGLMILFYLKVKNYFKDDDYDDYDVYKDYKDCHVFGEYRGK